MRNSPKPPDVSVDFEAKGLVFINIAEMIGFFENNDQLEVRLNRYMRKFLKELIGALNKKNIKQTFVRFLLLLDEQDIETGKFKKKVSGGSPVELEIGLFQSTLKTSLTQFFGDDFWFTYSRAAEQITVSDYRERFPGVSKENVLLINADMDLTIAFRESIGEDIIAFKPCRHGEIDPSNLEELDRQLGLFDNFGRHCVINLDLDGTLLLRVPTILSSKTILNPAVVSLLYKIFEKCESQRKVKPDIRFITSRHLRPDENDSERLLSAAAIKKTLEDLGFAVSKITHTNRQPKASFLLKDLGRSECHIFLDDSPTELLVAKEKQDDFAEKDSSLILVKVARGDEMPDDLVGRVVTMIERLSCVDSLLGLSTLFALPLPHKNSPNTAVQETSQRP